MSFLFNFVALLEDQMGVYLLPNVTERYQRKSINREIRHLETKKTVRLMYGGQVKVHKFTPTSVQGKVMEVWRQGSYEEMELKWFFSIIIHQSFFGDTCFGRDRGKLSFDIFLRNYSSLLNKRHVSTIQQDCISA